METRGFDRGWKWDGREEEANVKKEKKKQFARGEQTISFAAAFENTATLRLHGGEGEGQRRRRVQHVG